MIYLLTITLIAAVLRLVNLSEFPANISPVELSFIYPLRHLLNYNLSLARLPFALIYTLTIPATVFLIWRRHPPQRLLTNAGFWTGMLLTFNPWHLLLSRRAVTPWQPWLNLTLDKFFPRFLEFFSPQYLFLTGDSTFLLTANSGLLLSVSLITLLIALASVPKFTRLFWQATGLILLASLLASFQTYFGNAHALALALFGWTVLLGWGIAQSLLKFRWLLFIFLPIFAYQSLTSLHNVFIQSHRLSQSQWELIYQPVADYLVTHQDKYNRIIIVPKYPHPREYLNWYSQGKIDQSKLAIDNYRDEYLDSHTLYIGHINEQIKHQVLDTFALPTGTVVLFAGSSSQI